jgi:DNA-binding response OmpR family regulator
MPLAMQTANSPLPPHILALDDDPSIRALVSDYLTENELRVTAVASGNELATVMEREAIDLVVLDLRLQGEDGMQIARKLRENSAVPILMLTGRAEEADRVMGLELGADDYLTKPFSPRTLLARVKALLRRAGIEQGDTVQAGRIALDLEAHAISIDGGAPVRLTRLETRLLQILVAQAGHVVSAERLLAHVWGHRGSGDRQLLKQLVHRLRQKLEKDPAAAELLHTESGVGYRLKA